MAGCDEPLLQHNNTKSFVTCEIGKFHRLVNFSQSTRAVQRRLASDGPSISVSCFRRAKTRLRFSAALDMWHALVSRQLFPVQCKNPCPSSGCADNLSLLHVFEPTTAHLVSWREVCRSENLKPPQPNYQFHNLKKLFEDLSYARVNAIFYLCMVTLAFSDGFLCKSWAHKTLIEFDLIS